VTLWWQAIKNGLFNGNSKRKKAKKQTLKSRLNWVGERYQKPTVSVKGKNVSLVYVFHFLLYKISGMPACFHNLKSCSKLSYILTSFYPLKYQLKLMLVHLSMLFDPAYCLKIRLFFYLTVPLKFLILHMGKYLECPRLKEAVQL